MPRRTELPEVRAEVTQLLTETELAAEEKAEWRKRGKCYGHHPDLWFPEIDGRGNVLDKTATKFALGCCAACEVRLVCLTWATFQREEDGIYGQRTPRHRRRLRQEAQTLRPELLKPECGTIDKYHQHKRKHEAPCQPCVTASTENQQGQRGP